MEIGFCDVKASCNTLKFEGEPQENFCTNVFRSFTLNFEELKKNEEYLCMDMLLNEGEIDLKKCPLEVIFKQLKTRDKIIQIFMCHIEELLKHGKSLEIELEYLKFKNDEVMGENNNLQKTLKKKEKLLKIRKSKKDKILKSKKDSFDKFTQTHLLDGRPDENDLTNLCKQENNNYCTFNVSPPPPEGITGEFSPKSQQNIDKDKANEFLDDNNLNDKCRGSNDAANDLQDNAEQNRSASSPNRNDFNKNVDEAWISENIHDEVQAVAEQVTNQLGYVFIDDFGMYYDHASGYFYDHKTCLYYDSNSGTYFYYDHESGSYVFHSQVSPQETIEKAPVVIEEHVKKKTISNETKKNCVREEGECSSTDEEQDERDEQEAVDNLSLNKVCIAEVEDKHATEVAPSLRLMGMNEDEKGCLHLVTVDGGKIGREGDVQVLLKNPSVSKVHAEISYESNGANDHHYYLKDLGSNNGTFVKGKRLSEPREQSLPVEIGHGWEIICGSVTLSCHIHPGLLTCNECEPGLMAAYDKKSKGASVSGALTKPKIEKERRRQNKVLKKKFSLNRFNEELQPNPAYKDRAVVRRKKVGSDNPYEKTQVASIDTNLSTENKGFQLLQKMGWSEGHGLGTTDGGIIEPVVPKYVSGRSGLGSDVLPEETPSTIPEGGKRFLTKERYGNICSSSSPDGDPPSATGTSTSAGPIPGLFKPIKFKSASLTQSSNGS